MAIDQQVTEAFLQSKFWSRIHQTDACWLWTGAGSRTLGKDYGRLNINGKMWLAHRLSYALTHGSIADGMFVIHACDNKLCVRPDHLRVGDHAENMRDMVAKGRSKTCPYRRWGRHGRPIPNVKLTAASVAAIRLALAAGEAQRSIAKRFGVCKANIYYIRHGLTLKAAAHGV